jgi:hypothetical protein
MTAQFPPVDCADVVGQGVPLARTALPDWPRLMNERMAAAYLSIGTTLLRELAPPKKIRGRSVWDRRDLDRLADALAGVVLDASQAESHSGEVERAWRERRHSQGKNA